MTDLADRILAALSGATPQAPLTLVQVAGRLAGPLEDLRHIETTLADLAARRAVNVARVGPDPERLVPVYWPTGIMPAAVPFRDLVIKAHTRADAAAAALSGQPTPPTSTPEQEPPMPSVTAPAAPRKAAPPAPRPYTERTRRALAHLAEHGPTHSRDLKAALGIDDDLEKYLARAIKDGQILSRPHRLPGTGGYLNRLYLLPEQDSRNKTQEASGDTPAAGEAPSPVPQAAAAPPAAGRVGIALWDDGELSIEAGDEVIRLPLEAVRRLDNLLERAQDLIWGGA